MQIITADHIPIPVIASAGIDRARIPGVQTDMVDMVALYQMVIAPVKDQGMGRIVQFVPCSPGSHSAQFDPALIGLDHFRPMMDPIIVRNIPGGYQLLPVPAVQPDAKTPHMADLTARQ